MRVVLDTIVDSHHIYTTHTLTHASHRISSVIIHVYMHTLPPPFASYTTPNKKIDRVIALNRNRLFGGRLANLYALHHHHETLIISDSGFHMAGL